MQKVALTSILPLGGGDSDTSFMIEGRPAARSQSETPVTWYREVSAGYFDLMGIRLVDGRGFAEREAAPSVVVNETFVAISRMKRPSANACASRRSCRLSPSSAWWRT